MAEAVKTLDEKNQYSASLSELKKALQSPLGTLDFKNGHMLWETSPEFSLDRLVVQVFNTPGTGNIYTFRFREGGLSSFKGDEEEAGIDFSVGGNVLKNLDTEQKSDLKLTATGLNTEESVDLSLTMGKVVADWLRESIKKEELTPFKLGLSYEFIIAE